LNEFEHISAVFFHGTRDYREVDEDQGREWDPGRRVEERGAEYPAWKGIEFTFT
jgi:hypothetical protein